MNDLRLATRTRRNVFKVKKNLPIRGSDGTIQFSRMDGSLNQAAEKSIEGLSVWVEVGVFQKNLGLEKHASDTHPGAVGLTAAAIDKDVFEARWKKLRIKAKIWWNKLSDDDLEHVDGKFEQLIRLLQIKYGYSRQQAEAEYSKRTK
jgi:uncharacterized protein YjbJ (UPF0337 family)